MRLDTFLGERSLFQQGCQQGRLQLCSLPRGEVSVIGENEVNVPGEPENSGAEKHKGVCAFETCPSPKALVLGSSILLSHPRNLHGTGPPWAAPFLSQPSGPLPRSQSHVTSNTHHPAVAHWCPVSCMQTTNYVWFPIQFAR